MNKKIFTWSVGCLFVVVLFVLPILAMASCEDWNAGSMQSEACIINLPLVRSYADFYYALMLFSSFVL